MATDEALQAEVKALRLAVTNLIDVALDEKVNAKVETEIAAQTVPRQELTDRLRTSGKKTVAGLTTVLLLLVLAVALNRYTLLQAQRDLNNQIVRCFLRPGDNTPAQARACERRFGNGYVESQERSREALGDFVDLRKWAKERGWTPPSER